MKNKTGFYFMLIKHGKFQYFRRTIFISLSTLVILVGGSLTVLWQLNQVHTSSAAGTSIVGPPSLPAATVDNILRRVGSPMAGTGKVIEQASRAANIDDAFALGVWWVETNDGAAGVGLADRNPGSVRGSPGYLAAFDGYTIYPSYAAAITDWFNVLHERYISRGLVSVYSICYPYVGTSSAPLWAGKVVNLMLRYRGEAPPAPMVVPTPTRAPLSARNHRSPWGDDITTTQATATVTNKTPTLIATSVPVTRPARIAAPIPVEVALQQSTEALPINKTFPLGMALLAALAIAFWGFKIRKEQLPLSEPVTTPWQLNDANQMYPPLYVNEYSPVLEQQPSSIQSELAGHRTEQLAFPTGVGLFSFAQAGQSPFVRTEQLPFSQVEQRPFSQAEQLPFSQIEQRPFSQIEQLPFSQGEQLSFPGLSPWLPAAMRASEPANTHAGPGLLSGYRHVQADAQHMLTPPADRVSEQLTNDSNIPPSPMAEMLSLPDASLPVRAPEPVAVRSGGSLLRRYGNTQ